MSRPTPVRFVLDLRKPPPPPPSMAEGEEEDCQNCEKLQEEVQSLRESQKALLMQVQSLTQQLQNNSRGSSSPRRLSTKSQSTKAPPSQQPHDDGAEKAMADELEQTRLQLRKLQEEHKVALELIVALGATLAHVPVAESGTPLRNSTEKSSAGKDRKGVGGTPSKRGSENRNPPFVVASDKGTTFNAHALYGNGARLDSAPQRLSANKRGTSS